MFGAYIDTKHGRIRRDDWDPAIKRFSDMRSMVEEAPAKEASDQFLKGVNSATAFGAMFQKG